MSRLHLGDSDGRTQYPDRGRIEALAEALRTGAVTFQPDGGFGFCLADLDSPLTKAVEADWPDDFEREAALWMAYREAMEERDQAHAAIRSLLSSLPFSAPENVAFLAQSKLAHIVEAQR